MSNNSLEPPISKEELESVLQSQLGKDVIVQHYSCSYATKPGENFGSTLLLFDINVKWAGKSSMETIHAIAKMAPPTGFLQQVFDVRNTFCKEMNLYKLVGPEILKLQKEHGVKKEDTLDVLAEYYGARTSLTGDQNEQADTNAVLLLENLRISGYKLADRMSGLDLKHCELVVSKLAQFHALPIALKQKKPQIYEQTVLKATSHFKMGGDMENLDEDYNKQFFETLQKNLPETNPYFERVQANALKYTSAKANISLNKGPFATIVHNDFWTNNMMFRYDTAGDNSSPVGVKFVDFQVTLNCSPVKDLIFFIFSSASTSVKKDSYDHLINLYYTNFISTLKQLQCDVSDFSFERFLEEIEEFAPTQLFHTCIMVPIIYAEEKSSKNLSEVGTVDATMQIYSNQTKVKMIETLEEFDKRGWM